MCLCVYRLCEGMLGTCMCILPACTMHAGGSTQIVGMYSCVCACVWAAHVRMVIYMHCGGEHTSCRLAVRVCGACVVVLQVRAGSLCGDVLVYVGCTHLCCLSVEVYMPCTMMCSHECICVDWVCVGVVWVGWER